MADSSPGHPRDRRLVHSVRLFLTLLAILAIAYVVDHTGSSNSDAARQPAPEPPPKAAAVRVDEALARTEATDTELARRSLPSTAAACRASLRKAGVDFREISAAAASGVAWPIRLTGPVAGVRIDGTGKPDAPTSFLDCRLATTLLAWAPRLRSLGVVALEHYSMYRGQSQVGGSEKPSGHASGRAIDVGRVELQDGRMLSVLDDWKNRRPSGEPCGTWRDAPAGQLLRRLVCDAAASGLFQTIVTPHHNAAHANHVHLEIDPAASELWIR